MASMTRRALLMIAALPAIPAASAGVPSDPLGGSIERIRPLFAPKRPPQPGDWLIDHDEPGQTYAQYRASVSVPVIERYSALRIVPIGSFTPGEREAFDTTTGFLAPFFGLSLVTDPPVRLEDLPESAQRLAPRTESRQLLTSYLLNEILRRRRQPRDAAVLGVTAVDLWPGPGWNFVFGQASLSERVGVWSMARNGDADQGAAMRRQCALRTVMTATHETGHMLGIRHCTKFECGMNGSNSVEERDGQPLEFCPECQPKLWWTLKLDPLRRSRALEVVARRHGFDRIAEGFARQSAALMRA